MIMILYRAANNEFITGPTSFASLMSSAIAYMDNPGFGGNKLYELVVDIDPSTVLDIRDDSQDAQVMALIDASGISMGATTADFLAVQERVADSLLVKGYNWIRLIDTFPEGSETWVFIGEDSFLLESEMELILSKS